jgi:uncharacterized protein (DUF2147 family)
MQHQGRQRVAFVVSFVVAVLAETNLVHHTDAQAQASVVAGENALIGEWWTEGKQGRIKFAKYADGTFRGVTTCCVPDRETSEHPIKDKNNPNPKLRDRTTVGIVIIWKLTYDDGEYSGGYVYNPRDGKTYRFEAKVIDHETVKIRGYIGLPLFGQSQIWKRVTAATTR